MWRLNSGLTACLTSGRLILLDETRDRYFAVPDNSVGAIEAWLRAADGSEAPAPLISALGKVSPGQLTNRQHVHVSVPEPVPGQQTASTAGIANILSVAGAVVATRVMLRTIRLHRILAKHRRARKAGPPIGPAELAQLARRFAKARRWCPIKRNCLLDSIALDGWMGHPASAEIVFGVIAQPFEAHCWVQSRANILNDSYDRVSRFEPILTV